MGLTTVDLKGPDKTSTSTDAEASRVACATPGKLYHAVGFNNGPDQYVMLFDAASLPADGAKPLARLKVFADQHFSFDFPRARKFSLGIVICNSTTVATKTIGAADCFFDVGYTPKPTSA